MVTLSAALFFTNYLQDYGVMAEVIERVKERLRGIPKLDTLSMPFRVSFTRVAAYW